MIRPALVFVVGDEPDFLEELGEAFGALGPDVEVHTLRSLDALKAHLARVSPDLIIVDWASVRYEHLTALADRAPVLALDHAPDPDRKRTALRDGVFEYLPLDGAYLDSVIAAFRRARRIPALESELRETEARYAAILDAASDGIFVVQGQVLSYVNDRFAAALGYDVDELANSSLESLAPPADGERIRENLARVALSSGSREIFDVTLLGADGAAHSFELACRSALMNGRRAIVGAARDVTAIRQLTREVEEYRRRSGHSERLRALGEIAAGVAHDFNNVLEVILGRIGLIGIRRERGEEIDTHLHVIATAAEDAAAILQRVKEFTRPADTAGWQDIEASDLVYDAAAFCRTRVPNNARLEVRIETARTIRGNPTQLREVLVNLIYNALDSISATGWVEVACYERNDNLCLSVTDDGPGVPPHMREKIFEPFFTTKEAQRGTGLGLSVSKEILRRHDVQLQLESVPHQRTCFELHFHSGTHRIGGAANLSRKVLVVDDDRAVGELIADVLCDADYEVLSVRDASDARRVIETQELGLLITDLDLDGDSGWELARAARRAHPHLIVGLVTGWPIGVETRDVRDRGVDFVLTKPFSPVDLLEALQRVR